MEVREDSVAFLGVVDDHSDRHEVVDLVEALRLLRHLPMDAVQVLYPPLYHALDPSFIERLLGSFAERSEALPQGAEAAVDSSLELVMFGGLQMLERQVF